MPIRSTRCILVALGVTGCVGSTGPTLPPNVGANHPGREARAAARQQEAPAEPVAVGTPVWANFHDTGFYFHAVVVDRREELHRVLYDDGASEWVPAPALLPDSLAEEAPVHVRGTFEQEFQSASVGRRLGQAVYVRLAGGDERWTTLPHVRFQAGQSGIPSRDDAPGETATPSPGQPGADVLVNYQLQGLRFAGTVTARAADGHAHVVYLDGESEWIDPGTFVADEVGPGTVVHVRRSWEPPVWVRGRVRRRIGSALEVELDDGGVAWTTMFRVRVPVEDAPRSVAPSEPAPEEPPAPARRRPRR